MARTAPSAGATRKLALNAGEGVLKGPELEFWKTPDGA